VDIPEVASVIVASAGKSNIKALQRLGRGMRVAGDKQTCELWDFADGGNRWLDAHSAARQAAYLAEGFDVVELAPGSAALAAAALASAG
jgi:superfamily II DNA or RNA helicase